MLQVRVQDHSGIATLAQDLELYMRYSERYKGRYNQHLTLHGSGAVIPTG